MSQIHNIMEWALANVHKTQQGANNATLNKHFPGANIEAIPFGSTVTTTNNVTATSGKLAQAALVALGLGAGALGLWKLAGPELVGEHTPATPAAVVPADMQPIYIEGILEWSVDENGNGRIDGLRTDTSPDPGGAEKD